MIISQLTPYVKMLERLVDSLPIYSNGQESFWYSFKHEYYQTHTKAAVD